MIKEKNSKNSKKYQSNPIFECIGITEFGKYNNTELQDIIIC